MVLEQVMTYVHPIMSWGDRACPEINIPGQSNLCEQLSYHSGYLNIFPQSICFCIADDAPIAHFTQQLRDYIVVALNLSRQHGRAEKVFEDIDDSVQKLEYRKWLRI
jgi:hypothetical protein